MPPACYSFPSYQFQKTRNYFNIFLMPVGTVFRYNYSMQTIDWVIRRVSDSTWESNGLVEVAK